MKKKNVTFVGLGYIGLPMALLFANNRYNTIGYDIDKKKINDLNENNISFDENQINDLFFKKKRKIYFTNKLVKSDVYFICLPTPVKKSINNYYIPDLEIIYKFIYQLKKILKEKDIIIIESTCPPGTFNNIKNKLTKWGFKNITLAICPERAVPGNTINEMIYNDRMIGVENQKDYLKVKKIYQYISKGKKNYCSPIEAELTKLFENTYRDVNIALANEFYNISNKYLANFHTIKNFANKHPRVNIHNSGIGVGGHCIPVDPWFIIDNKKKNSLIYLSRIINTDKTIKTLKVIEKKIQKINKNKKILIYGITFKENVSDIRNSPAYLITKKILKKFDNINVYDPHNLKLNNISFKNLIKTKFEHVFILVKHDKLPKLRSNKVELL